MSNSFSFVISGKPCTQGSKDQFGRETNRRLPGWRSDARDAAYKAMPPDWRTDAKYLVTFFPFFERPKTHTVGRKGLVLKDGAPEFPGRVGDVDKIERALLDALTGVLWDDDDQVVGGLKLKGYASAATGIRRPYTHVQVVPVCDWDSAYLALFRHLEFTP